MALSSQTDSTPLTTACLDNINSEEPQNFVAVSRDLLEEYPCGTIVSITGTNYDGIYKVSDVMNKRFTNRVDILIKPTEPIGKWVGIITKL
jgi:3D (Asp-Asp-Asp) domain-containing protein